MFYVKPGNRPELHWLGERFKVSICRLSHQVIHGQFHTPLTFRCQRRNCHNWWPIVALSKPALLLSRLVTIGHNWRPVNVGQFGSDYLTGRVITDFPLRRAHAPRIKIIRP